MENKHLPPELNTKANFAPTMASVEIPCLFRQVNFFVSKGCNNFCIELLCM